jgi:hypothetical protein
VSRFDPRDEVQFEIQHGKTSRAPQLTGELVGTSDSVGRSLTIPQRFAALFGVAVTSLYEYVGLASIVWLADSHLNFSTIAPDIVFLLASTAFLDMTTAPMLRRKALKQHPKRLATLVPAVILTLIPLRVASFSIAWASGLRLWFPSFIIYVTATWIAEIIMGLKVISSGAGLARQDFDVSPAIAVFTTALCPTVFAVCVVAGIRTDLLVVVGALCILTSTIIRLNRQRLRQRISLALGSPQGRSVLHPPRKPES